MKIMLFFMLLLYSVSAQTSAPTTNASIPGFATLRPTSPIVSPSTFPDSDRDTPINKSDELSLFFVYVIMVSLSAAISSFEIMYGLSVFGDNKKKKRKVASVEQW